MSADGARQTQSQGVELWRSRVTHCCSTYPEFLCAVCTVNLSSASIPRGALVHGKLVLHSPFHYYQPHWLQWLLTLLCPSEVSSPLTSSFTVCEHKLDQILPIYREKPPFTKKQGFSYTMCKLYSHLCIAHAGFSPSTINIFISANLTRLESIHACVQDALEHQGSLSDLCRTAKILWVLSSLDLFS